MIFLLCTNCNNPLYFSKKALRALLITFQLSDVATPDIQTPHTTTHTHTLSADVFSMNGCVYIYGFY